ncbi:hypothetical protein OLMES_4185 [Oleiphilus messinensis]|uniref:Uncharacterized protein n=1 Tax=Oleiphilus messinensis TaxID=141451 RepID=A0A1Y0ICK9_9GAMM|nr:hypothetical protein OLMES_4185 [Oleiphilus messinensis]
MFVTLANSAEIASQSSTQLNNNPLQPQTLPGGTQPTNAEYPQNPATVNTRSTINFGVRELRFYDSNGDFVNLLSMSVGMLPFP